MPRQFKRADRVAEELRRLLSEAWDREFASHAPGMVTFIRIRLSNDPRHAKAYWSYLGKDEDRPRIEEMLEREAGKLRHLVGKGLTMRHLPELTFRFDPSIEEGIRIEKLLGEIKRDSEK